LPCTADRLDLPNYLILNERVELAMQILECRRKLRQPGGDQIEIEKLQAEMARLEQELREIDE
jgi:hypothetical protein